MVIILSGRKSPVEKEIIDILKLYGASYISDREIVSLEEKFTVISEYKKTNLNINHATVLFIDNTDRFDGQKFPLGITGICEEGNTKALCLFKKSGVPVICCGMGSKNTVTISSLNSKTLLATLQRTVKNGKGIFLYPEEFKIKLTKKYSPFAIMASVAILLLEGIVPTEF